MVQGSGQEHETDSSVCELGAFKLPFNVARKFNVVNSASVFLSVLSQNFDIFVAHVKFGLRLPVLHGEVVRFQSFLPLQIGMRFIDVLHFENSVVGQSVEHAFEDIDLALLFFQVFFSCP